MLKAVFLACLVVAAAARPRDTVISIDQDNHKHTQKGQAGTAVTGTYQVIGVDGSIHEVRYIADERGFRVLGEGAVAAPSPAPAPVPAPTTPPAEYLAPLAEEYLPPPPAEEYLPPPPPPPTEYLPPSRSYYSAL